MTKQAHCGLTIFILLALAILSPLGGGAWEPFIAAIMIISALAREDK